MGKSRDTAAEGFIHATPPKRGQRQSWGAAETNIGSKRYHLHLGQLAGEVGLGHDFCSRGGYASWVMQNLASAAMQEVALFLSALNGQES